MNPFLWLDGLREIFRAGRPQTKKAKERAKNRESPKARRHRKVRRSLAKAGRRAARRGR